jgi:hypothetical protein
MRSSAPSPDIANEFQAQDTRLGGWRSGYVVAVADPSQ